MSKRLPFIFTFALSLGTIDNASAASTLKMTCSGNLTNTRADGVTLGQCDLNFLPVKAMNEIEDVCGIPGTVDTPAENQCRIRAVISPDPISAADHRKLYKVLEVWSVDKR
jgi:hypothetical protein